MDSINFNLLAEWSYSEQEWNEFVAIERTNKKEDNIYFGIGILILCSIGLMLFRQTSFLLSLCFAIPFAILIPFLRMKFSYSHLKKNIQNPSIKIYTEYLLINEKKIELISNKRRIKSIKIVDTKNNLKLLEFDVQWLTSKGPTNDEFRILIPNNKIEEAKKIITTI